MSSTASIGPEAAYTLENGSVFLTGIQALVRLPLMQRRMDRKLGLNTAGFISGYRGSPLGGYDQQLWKAQAFLDNHDVVFQPGLNEELAATSLWGTQMHKAFGPTTADGVFGIWYGKGNGVDRTGDAFRHANMMGTSPLGGVLALAGDDHGAQSSTFPLETDGIFESVKMPVLQPASVSELLSLGLAGFALSRFSGLWVAMKANAEVVESAASIDLPDSYPVFESPSELVPAHGLNWDPTLTWPAQRPEMERRLIEERLPAAIGWAIANRIDKPIFASSRKRLCIVTLGKAHQDAMQALDLLGIGEDEAEALGISIYKVAMSWPLAADPLIAFADGAQEILVVEEKGATVEDQLKAALYNKPGKRPAVSGKVQPDGTRLLPATMELSPLQVAEAIVARMEGDGPINLKERFTVVQRQSENKAGAVFPVRKPFFCPGCPHNTSTKTPDGSMSGGGIGCHVLAISQPELKTPVFSQMGSEGLQWVGAAHFSKTQHMFQNLGDGTYQHSGLLAVRAAVATNTNITFKILYNDAVAMTGGQPADGMLDPAQITRQLDAEGVRDIHLVSDDPDRWEKEAGLAAGVTVAHRDRLDEIQRHLRTVPGVTAIVYEQTCAAEKRRRRKHGAFPDPDRRIFINSRVCEGCGDCSVQSNCIAVEPLDTQYGRKRRINQSSCNKDFSCIKGFCPSFVEIDGPVLRKPDGDRLKQIEADLFAQLPEVGPVTLDGPYNIYVAGIGGLGVLTVGALLGAAAHLEGKRSTVLDFTGLSQKNGAVVSQIRIAPKDASIHAVRIVDGEADLLLGTDLVVSVAADALSKLQAGRSHAVVNSHAAPTADVVANRDATLQPALMLGRVRRATGGQMEAIPATELAEGLFGNNVAANTMMIGYAWQKGLVPVSLASLREAITANGAAVSLNLRALDWGRMAAVDLKRVEEVAGISTAEPKPESVKDLVARLKAELIEYQGTAYAARYAGLLGKAHAAVSKLGAGGEDFVRAVARNAYKLMAYKDEYEVARLYGHSDFRDALTAQFSGTKRLSVYLAPPLLSRTDPKTGRPAKRKFGPWIFKAFGLLAKGKMLRGTWADPFGYTQERKAERALRDGYIATILSLCADVDTVGLDRAVEIANLPDMVRGYGPVKEAAMAQYESRLAELLNAPADQKLDRAA